MNQSKRTKKTLISSIVALVLCLAMLIGSTLAWFTDTINVTADINVGSLKVALEKYVDGEYKNIGTKDGNAGYTESTEPVFGGTGWTPNQTEVYYLAVNNEGKIAFNYDMKITLEGDMAGALEYAIIDGLQKGSADADAMDVAVEQKKWDNIKAAASETGLVEAGELEAAPNGHLEVGATDYFALVLHMDENAGNEYQGTYFNADIVVNARQVSYIAPAEDEGEDPLARFTDVLVYDFENNFAFGAYNATTGVGAYKPAPSTITVGEEGGNHFGRMTRIWDTKPASLSGVAAPRMQFNELAAAVEGEYIYAVSFDIKNFNAESFASFSIPGLKLHDDVITVCFTETDTPVTLVDLSDGEWHTVVAVYDTIYGTVQYYGDGELLEGKTGTFTGTGFSAEGYLRFQIDQWGYPALPTETLVGNNDFGIDNFKIMTAPVEDPFKDYTTTIGFDFENDFALGKYNATTGAAAYAPSPATITIEAESEENHFMQMSRMYDTRPATMGTAFRVRFQEVFNAVLEEDVVVYSFDIKQLVADSFLSFGIPGLKLTNDKITVCFTETDTPVTLVDLSDGEWHNVAVEMDYANSVVKYYGDYIPCSKTGTSTLARSQGGYWGLQVDAFGYPAMDEADKTNNVKIALDNVKVMVPPEPVVTDPFAEYTVAKEYDFENGFTLGAYNATTGIGSYVPNKTNDANTIVEDADGNHYVYMSRNYTTRPAALPTAPRIQFNEIFPAEVIAADVVVYSFDVMQDVADSFMSIGWGNIKLTNDKVSVSLGENQEVFTLVDLSDGEWHNIAVKVDYVNNTTQFYGDWIPCSAVVPSAAPARSATGYLRFQPDAYNWPAMDEGDKTNNYGVGIDNFRVLLPN